MRLSKFIKKFVNRNALVRLVFPQKNGHMCVGESWDTVSPAWEILKGEGPFRDFLEFDVKEITDIIITEHLHKEAINIVIKSPFHIEIYIHI